MKTISEFPDYWVPEDHLFKSGAECLEKFPDQAAAGVSSCEKLRKAIEALQGMGRMWNYMTRHGTGTREIILDAMDEMLQDNHPDLNNVLKANEVLKDLGEL